MAFRNNQTPRPSGRGIGRGGGHMHNHTHGPGPMHQQQFYPRQGSSNPRPHFMNPWDPWSTGEVPPPPPPQYQYLQQQSAMYQNRQHYWQQPRSYSPSHQNYYVPRHNTPVLPDCYQTMRTTAAVPTSAPSRRGRGRRTGTSTRSKKNETQSSNNTYVTPEVSVFSHVQQMYEDARREEARQQQEQEFLRQHTMEVIEQEVPSINQNLVELQPAMAQHVESSEMTWNATEAVPYQQIPEVAYSSEQQNQQMMMAYGGQQIEQQTQYQALQTYQAEPIAYNQPLQRAVASGAEIVGPTYLVPGSLQTLASLLRGSTGEVVTIFYSGSILNYILSPWTPIYVRPTIPAIEGTPIPNTIPEIDLTTDDARSTEDGASAVISSTFDDGHTSELRPHTGYSQHQPNSDQPVDLCTNPREPLGRGPRRGKENGHQEDPEDFGGRTAGIGVGTRNGSVDPTEPTVSGGLVDVENAVEPARATYAERVRAGRPAVIRSTRDLRARAEQPVQIPVVPASSTTTTAKSSKPTKNKPQAEETDSPPESPPEEDQPPTRPFRHPLVPAPTPPLRPRNPDGSFIRHGSRLGGGSSVISKHLKK